jgi:hypothetical protein
MRAFITYRFVLLAAAFVMSLLPVAAFASTTPEAVTIAADQVWSNVAWDCRRAI